MIIRFNRIFVDFLLWTIHFWPSFPYVTEESKRITIGLFGKDVPKTVPGRGGIDAKEWRVWPSLENILR
jgi:hypothetical protein